jgi:hypothetical protein
MITLFNKYSIPIEIQRTIMGFLQDTFLYNKIIKELSKGIHRSYVRGNIHKWQAYDIFKIQLEKCSIVVKLTDMYNINNTSLYICNQSPSAPYFCCKLCRKYHQLNCCGEKYCPILNKTIF